jgi:hypothetical protein
LKGKVSRLAGFAQYQTHGTACEGGRGCVSHGSLNSKVSISLWASASAIPLNTWESSRYAVSCNMARQCNRSSAQLTMFPRACLKFVLQGRRRSVPYAPCGPPDRRVERP